MQYLTKLLEKLKKEREKRWISEKSRRSTLARKLEMGTKRWSAPQKNPEKEQREKEE